MRTMTGTNNHTMGELFEKQKRNQEVMLEKGKYNDYTFDVPKSLPVDDVKLASYHIQQLMSEIGEVLDADKRWKNFRNEKYDKDAKLEEIADCFIVMMNVAMFSGINADELSKAINEKIDKVYDRINGIE